MGAVSSVVEPRFYTPVVAGSNPAPPTPTHSLRSFVGLGGAGLRARGDGLRPSPAGANPGARPGPLTPSGRSLGWAVPACGHAATPAAVASGRESWGATTAHSLPSGRSSGWAVPACGHAATACGRRQRARILGRVHAHSLPPVVRRAGRCRLAGTRRRPAAVASGRESWGATRPTHSLRSFVGLGGAGLRARGDGLRPSPAGANPGGRGLRPLHSLRSFGGLGGAALRARGDGLRPSPAGANPGGGRRQRAPLLSDRLRLERAPRMGLHSQVFAGS